MTDAHPQLRQTVLDCLDPRPLAEFYRQLLGYVWRPGCETADPAGDDWLVIHDPNGVRRLAFQRVDELPRSTWPGSGVPQQLHLDFTVATTGDLQTQHERALRLGATLLLDRFDHPDEPLRVYADPAGHPFCIFVAPPV